MLHLAKAYAVNMQNFMKKCQEISFQVLSCFALGLGFKEDFFTKVGLHVAPVYYPVGMRIFGVPHKFLEARPASKAWAVPGLENVKCLSCLTFCMM